MMKGMRNCSLRCAGIFRASHASSSVLHDSVQVETVAQHVSVGGNSQDRVSGIVQQFEHSCVRDDDAG